MQSARQEDGWRKSIWGRDSLRGERGVRAACCAFAIVFALLAFLGRM